MQQLSRFSAHTRARICTRHTGRSAIYLHERNGDALAHNGIFIFESLDCVGGKRYSTTTQTSEKVSSGPENSTVGGKCGSTTKEGKQNFDLLLKNAIQTKNATRAVLAVDAALRAKTLSQPDCLTVMKIYKLANKPEKCHELLGYMAAQKIPVNRQVYLPAVSAYGASGDYMKARTLFEESKALPGQYNRPQLYSAMIGACAKAIDGSKWMEAIGFFEEMRQNDVLITTPSHNAVIGALVKGKRYAAAKEWYKTLEPMQRTRVLYSIMARAGMDTNDSILATSVLKEAEHGAHQAMRKANARGIRPSYPITDVYNAVLSIHLNQRNIGKAMKLFEKMNLHRYRHSAKPNSQTYSLLLVYSANEFLWDDLISAAQMARENYSFILPYAYKHAVSICKENNREDLVVKLEAEMQQMSKEARERLRRNQVQLT